jgi:phosphonate transport system ATP-binding protein
MLKLDGLSRKFGRNIVVDVASLAIPDGQMVGIIGPEDAGKSTLLRLLNRLVDPSEGRILFEDIDIAQLKGREVREWRSNCAMICTQFTLVAQLNVMSNVLAGLLAGLPHWRTKARIFTPRERALALRALTRVGMAHAAHQRVEVLSLAGQKRVAIARALVQQPKFLLADDPIRQLDPAEASVVIDGLREINRQDGVTVLCALGGRDTEHAKFDRIIGMRDGRIVFDGAPSVLGAAQLHAIFGAEADASSISAGRLGSLTPA